MWDVVYNPTAEVIKYPDGQVESNRMFFTNTWDVIHQKNNELSLNNMMSLDDYLRGLLGHEVSPSEFAALREFVQPDYENLIKQYSGRNMDTIIDNFHRAVPVQFAGVLKRIQAGNNLGVSYKKEPIAILLLPHSQGNLYANELYQYLTLSEDVAKNHIAIYGIASPAEKNLGDWPIFDETLMISKLKQSISFSVPVTGYVTSCEDKVIDLLRTGEDIRAMFKLFNIVLPGSVQIPGIAACNDSSATGGADAVHHSLVDYYLADSNPKLKTRIAKNINFYVYALDYNLMKDLNYNMVPYNEGYNKYPQTLAFIIGDEHLTATKLFNDTQILTGPTGKIYGYDYDINANKSGFLYVKEPLLGAAGAPIMRFMAVPSSRIVSNGYNPKGVYSVYEDSKNGKYRISLNSPFHIYPYNENSPQHDADPNNWNYTFVVDSYPWNYNSNMDPWNPKADGTCEFAGWSTLFVAKNTSFADIRYGIELIQNNPKSSKLNDCMKMPPTKYADGLILDGWWNNPLIP